MLKSSYARSDANPEHQATDDLWKTLWLFAAVQLTGRFLFKTCVHTTPLCFSKLDPEQ